MMEYLGVMLNNLDFNFQAMGKIKINLDFNFQAIKNVVAF